jgi:hypothetical protein
MIIGQTKALPMQMVKVGGLEDWISVCRDLGITLIIGHDNQDIGLTGNEGYG